VIFGLFILNYFLQKFGASSAFSRNYLDDLLCVPIVYWLTRLVLRITHRQPQLELEFGMLVLGFLIIVVLFEWLLPVFFNIGVQDIFDVFCYGSGVIVYQLSIEKQQK